MVTGEPPLVTAWYSGAWWLWLLRPLEAFFRLVVIVRRDLYRWGVLKQFRASKPVVVIGNITVGGTGKTPVVLSLVEYLIANGVRVGVVSRGYGATARQFPHTVNTHSTARDCGDETLLIFLRTACPCVVSPSRSDAVRQLLRDFEVDIILSDDGLQHYALARDLEIAILDFDRQLGNGFCLPAGPLREPRARLATVDHILYRGSSSLSNGVFYQPQALVNLRSGAELALANLTMLGSAIYGLAGIGQPAQFLSSLDSLGFTAEPMIFPDHHEYCAEDFVALDDKPIIMTEKDAVKCRDLVGDNAWYLKINAIIPAAVAQAVAALATDSVE